MEILNNIWSALSTENRSFTMAISFVFTFLEAYIIFLIFVTFLKIPYTKVKRNIYIISGSLVSLLSKYLIPSPINTIVNYLFLFFLTYKLFNLKLLKTIFAIIIPFFTFAVVSTLILNPIIKVLKIDSYILTTVPIYKLIYSSTLYVLLFLIIYLLKLKDRKMELLDDLNNRTQNIIIINLLLGIFTLIVQLIITAFYINILPIYVTFLSCISLIFYFIISFYSFNHIIKLQITTRNLENAESYNNTLSILYDNVKGFKHDFDNIVHMLGGYIKTNDMNGLKKYYSELETDCEKLKSIATLNPNMINNPGIYNLLITKYKKANELNIKINLEYFFDFEKLNMPIYPFSRMLGILLDNAIEAAQTSLDKEINITFRDSNTNQTQIVIIENTYSNKYIDTSKIFEKGVSEKENHSGMGLWEVGEIIKKNNNIKLVTTNNEKYFKQQLEIYY